MSENYANLLNPAQARIFRIIHRANLPWVLENGLHCGNSQIRAANWVSIGNQNLIATRARWPVKAPSGGVLNDYVPFYFTPFSVMMHNINTGWNGVTKHPKQDILILVSSLHRIQDMDLTFFFTDSHANNKLVRSYTALADLDKVDWDILQRRYFKRDPDDPAKFDRYQAEALVHRHVPLQGLSGIVCYNNHVKMDIEHAMAVSAVNLPIIERPGWYF